MTRRNLLGLIALLFAPRAPGHGTPTHSGRMTSAQEPSRYPSENALAEWLRLPMQPILDPGTLAAADQKTASLLLDCTPLGRACKFTYLGGSEPGTDRQVLPILLFQKIDPDPHEDEPRDAPTYLLAFCQSRNSPRTFRLDRIRDCHAI